MSKFRKSILLLVIAVITQGCLRARLDARVIPTARDIEPAQTESPVLPTSTLLPSPIVARTATELSPTPLPSVTITAVNGNIYIRRGPGLEYNQIGILHRDASAKVIARDVLSGWVQVNIPDSSDTGWVSVQTKYSTLEGDINQLPDFTFTEWPLPAYIKNCTEHDMFISPGDIYLPSLYTNAEYKNEIQVNPGSYTAYDLFVPGEPEAERFEIREGVTAYITMNGLDVRHKCP